MAASSVFGSAGWVFETEKFKAFMGAGYVERSDLIGIIKGDYIDKIYNGLKQFFYWSRRLQGNANSVVLTLTFLSQEGLLKPDINSLHKIIFSLLGYNGIININYHENANFVSLVMNCPEAALSVRQEVVELNGALVCYVDHEPSNVFKVRVLWSPLFYPLDNIIQLFKQWCEQVELHFENDSFENGDVIPNNRISGRIKLKEGTLLSTIPHITRLTDTIDNFVLIVIKERRPLCLKCRHEGHIRKFCPSSRCSRCGRFHEVNGKCLKSTYSQIVGEGKLNRSDAFVNKDQVVISEQTSQMVDHVDWKEFGNGSDVSQIYMPAIEKVESGLATRRVARSMIKKGSLPISSSFSEMNKPTLLVSNSFGLLNDELDSEVADNFLEADESRVKGDSSSVNMSLKVDHDSDDVPLVENRDSLQELFDRGEICNKRSRDSDEYSLNHLITKKSRDQVMKGSEEENAGDTLERLSNKVNDQLIKRTINQPVTFGPWTLPVKWPVCVICKYCNFRVTVISQPYSSFRCRNCPKHYSIDMDYNIIYMR